MIDKEVDDMTDDELFKSFKCHKDLYVFLDDNPEEKKLFLQIARAFHEIKIDWYPYENRKNYATYFGIKKTDKNKATAKYGKIWLDEEDEEKILKIEINPKCRYKKIPITILQSINDDGKNSIIKSNLDEAIEFNLDKPIVIKIKDGINELKEDDLKEGRGKGHLPKDYPNQPEPDNTDNQTRSHDTMKKTNEEESVTPTMTIYYGPPGTGKTKILVDNLKEKYTDRFKFVTFHQSYGYEEFVEGIKPILASHSSDERNDGQIRYNVEDGIFKKLCKQAKDDPENRYAMVIDEINRGNISKIFGELITLIEPSKRLGSAEHVPITLPYSGEEFGVPSNLDIYGSMNTADRSLALLDTALRRRFNFKALYPEPGHLQGIRVLKDGSDTKIKLRKMLASINQRIEVLHDRDHTIGHGYFLAECQDDMLPFEKLETIFKEKIIPLLEEYFFEDKAKIALVLGDGIKANSKYRFYEEKSIGFIDLFGTQIEQDSIEKRSTYTLNPNALSEVETYTGIYSKTPSHASDEDAADGQ